MKQKFYHLVGKAVDANGLEHIVTIVGEYTKGTEEFPEIANVGVERKENNMVDGLLIFPNKRKVRRLRYAYSICHTDDLSRYDEELGVELAKRRIKNNPLGELETTFKTSLCDDQIKLILFGELKHIMDNVDKFIEKL